MVAATWAGAAVCLAGTALLQHCTAAAADRESWTTSRLFVTLSVRPLPAGTTEKASEQKKGYKLPRHIMTNGDLARVINRCGGSSTLLYIL